MSKIEVMTGPGRRRRWQVEHKRALVAEAFAPGAVVADVARRAEICSGQIYRWRQEFRAASGFAAVVVAPYAHGDGHGDDSALGAPIEIEFAHAARMRIGASAPPALAVAIVRALMHTTTAPR